MTRCNVGFDFGVDSFLPSSGRQFRHGALLQVRRDDAEAIGGCLPVARRYDPSAASSCKALMRASPRRYREPSVHGPRPSGGTCRRLRRRSRCLMRHAFSRCWRQEWSMVNDCSGSDRREDRSPWRDQPFQECAEFDGDQRPAQLRRPGPQIARCCARRAGWRDGVSAVFAFAIARFFHGLVPTVCGKIIELPLRPRDDPPAEVWYGEPPAHRAGQLALNGVTPGFPG